MNAISQATMFKQNGGPVSISSVLIPITELKAETVDAIRNAAVLAAVNKAFELWGRGQTLTVRDLNATDMGYTNNVFTDTSNGTANQWNAMACGAFTVPTATVIAIYGVAMGWITDATIDECPITGIRIDVGGSRQAQWHLQCLDQICSAASTTPMTPRAGVTRSPIVAAEDITVTPYEYTRRLSVAYSSIWMGVAVEKEGVTLKP
jgi:hypothetical protein